MNNLLFYLFVIGIILSILILRSRAVIACGEIAETISLASVDLFSHTIKAIALNLFGNSPFPICLWMLSNIFDNIGSTQGRIIGLILFHISLITWFLLFLRSSLKLKGLANNHFRWRLEDISKVLRNRILLLLILILPIFFLSSLALSSKIVAVSESFGRLLFIAFALITSFIMHPITAPSGTLFTELNKGPRSNLIYKLRYVIFFAATIFPFLSAMLASFGYIFTAHHLYLMDANSIAIAIVGIYLYAVISRLILTQRRQLAILKRQEVLEANKGNTTNESKSAIASHIDTDEPTIFSISNQTNNVIIGLIFVTISLGIWGIWRDVLPAVKIFGEFELWTTDTKVTTIVTLPNGISSKQLVDKIIPITLADLLNSLVILALTFWSAQNIQGFLQFAILQRLSIDKGIRFAASTLVKYALMLIGIVGACYAIGLGWGKLQWLVTGVSVGIGFGLQEIFANFISGLIILFERPLRVGDFVQIGDDSGYVTHIQIRATTILTLERKEIIIPNKEFITGKIINWTLSESMFRLNFPIGVAYNSDMKTVERVLLEIADNHPEIPKDPAPKVMLINFGDSSINYELKVYIPGPDKFPSIQNEINRAITEAFRENNIEIPFPQMDLHVIKEQNQT